MTQDMDNYVVAGARSHLASRVRHYAANEESGTFALRNRDVYDRAAEKLATLASTRQLTLSLPEVKKLLAGLSGSTPGFSGNKMVLRSVRAALFRNHSTTHDFDVLYTRPTVDGKRPLLIYLIIRPKERED
jgi:hypothetical protein